MFTSFQKKVLAIALTCIAICLIGAFIVLLFNLFASFLSTFSAVITPLVFALVLSFILSPLVNILSQKCKISKKFSCWIVGIFAVAFVALVCAIAVPKAISEFTRIAQTLPQVVSEGAQWTAQEFPEFSEAIKKNLPKIREYFSENVSPAKITDLAKRVIKTTLSATGGLVSFFSFIAGFAVVPIYLYYMLTANCDFYTQLEKNLSRIGFLSESKREDIVFFVRRFVEIMVAFFRGQLLIALIMGLLIGCGLWIAGVKFGFLLGFCAGILNLIPYLGTIIGLGTIIPVSIFQDGGGWMLASISLAVFCAVQCLEGYVLTPRIMGDRTGLHPTVIIFSVFFWGIALHGILGMIFAIPFSAFIVCAWDRISNRWLAKD